MKTFDIKERPPITELENTLLEHDMIFIKLRNPPAPAYITFSLLDESLIAELFNEDLSRGHQYDKMANGVVYEQQNDGTFRESKIIKEKYTWVGDSYPLSEVIKKVLGQFMSELSAVQ